MLRWRQAAATSSMKAVTCARVGPPPDGDGATGGSVDEVVEGSSSGADVEGTVGRSIIGEGPVGRGGGVVVVERGAADVLVVRRGSNTTRHSRAAAVPRLPTASARTRRLDGCARVTRSTGPLPAGASSMVHATSTRSLSSRDATS